MSRRGATQVASAGPAQAPAFDEGASGALAIVTLLVTGDSGDLGFAGALLEELMERPGGEYRLVQGLSSVCAGLVALLEFFGGLTPGETLRELGRLISQAAAAE